MEPTPDVWAIVELMGHVRLAGRLTEEEKFGAKLGRLDIPSGDGFVTQYFGGGSVYRITIVNEDAARAVAQHAKPRPVEAWAMPKQPQLAAGGDPAEPPGDVGRMPWDDDDEEDSVTDDDHPY